MRRMIRTTGLVMCTVMMLSGLCGCGSSEPEVKPAPAVANEPVSEPIQEEEPAEEMPEESQIPGDAVSTLYLGGAEDATAGMEKVDDKFNDDGSYRYEHVSDDGMLSVCETGRLLSGNESSNPEEAAIEMASWILLGGETIEEATVESIEEYSVNTTYPVYIVSFYTGSNEDTWSWKAFTVATDTCGLVYAVGGPADFDEDMLAFCDKNFPRLKVIDKDEGLDTNDGEYKTDLFAYYGMNIADVAVDFPDLIYDDSYKNSDEPTEVSGPTGVMERMSDGFALAGPFFSINKEGTVVGISYGGKTYCVNEINVGMPMSEAKELAKKHDFKFSSVEITHGDAKYVAIYDNGQVQFCITSDADGNVSKTEESDVTGNVYNLMINKLK